jgi:hypothetical protein
MSTKFSLKIVRTYGVVVTVVSSLLLVLQNLKNPKSNKGEILDFRGSD